MPRLIVTDPEHATEAPFLRGILTRSLQEAGLSFDYAYGLSSEIRLAILKRACDANGDERIELPLRKLEATVIRALRRAGDLEALERYRARGARTTPIGVAHGDRHVSSFSRAYHQRGLESCGLSSSESLAISRQLYQRLLGEGRRVVPSYELDTSTHELIAGQLGPEAARRYLVWRDFVRSRRPLILLLGGTAGCGKSTVATAIANRLEIVRTQSTDMLREVMRVMLPPRLLPVLHTSSFDAWKGLPRAEVDTIPTDALLADGFRAQADLISVACEAVLQRAIRERVSLILEGVHVQPSLLARIPRDTDALVVPVMLAVLNARTLRARIRGRGSKAPGRRASRYLGAFDCIWRLQSYLLSEADRLGIQIVRNSSEEQVFTEIMRVIIDRLSKGFDREPHEVFAARRAAPSAADR